MTPIILLSEDTITSLFSYTRQSFKHVDELCCHRKLKEVVKLALTLQSRLSKMGKLYCLGLEVRKTISLCHPLIHTDVLSQVSIRKPLLQKYIMHITQNFHLHIILGCHEKHLQNKLKYVNDCWPKQQKSFVSQVNRSTINFWYIYKKKQLKLVLPLLDPSKTPRFIENQKINPIQIKKYYCSITFS